MGLPVALGECFVLSIFNFALAMNLDSVDSSIRLEAKYNQRLMEQECCKLLGLQPRRQTKSPSSCQLDTLFFWLLGV